MKQAGSIHIAAISGALAVAAGAIGAHALTGKISDELLVAFETGARYHLIHSVVLLVLSLCGDEVFRISYRLMAGGIILFSGSLYGMALADLSGSYATFLGPVTPLGGLLLIGGWVTMAFRAGRIKKGR